MLHISCVVLLCATMLTAGDGTATDHKQSNRNTQMPSLSAEGATAESAKPTLFSGKSADLFSFLGLSFRERTLQFINENRKLLEYFPIGVQQAILNGLQSDATDDGPSFVDKFHDTYNGFMNSLPDFSGISSAASAHAAKMMQGAEAGFDATVSEALCARQRLTPILFVPGLLGSALEERRTNATWLPAECYCSSAPGSEWSRSWVSLASFLGYRCWREVLKLSIRDVSGRMEPDSASVDVKELISDDQWQTGSTTSVIKGFFLAVKNLFAPKSQNTVDSLEYEVVQYPKELPVPLEKAQNKGQHEFSHRLMRAKFPEGIEVRPIGDGIEATRCLDSSNSWTCQTTSYFKELLDYITRKPVAPTSAKGFAQAPEGDDTAKSNQCPHYVLRKNIDVIPFDFRLGGYELYHSMESTGDQANGEYGRFFESMKQKVEALYDANGDRVAIVTHSLGGPLAVAFMNTYVDEEWKEKYMKKIVTIAAPFGGAVKAMQAALVGETESALVPAWSAQSMLSSWPGLYMVFPTESANKDSAVNQSEPLVEVHGSSELNQQDIVRLSIIDRAIARISRVFFSQPSNTVRDSGDLNAPNHQRFTARELPHVIRNHPNVSSIYAEHLERLRPLFDAFRSPPRGVDIDCIYSTGIQTTKKLVYRTFDEKDAFSPQIVTDDHGDGTVRTESLGLCRSWETDENIDVDLATEERVNLFEQFAKVPTSHRKRKPIRRTIELAGVNHVDIISSTPEVWDFIIQSANSV